ncbi:LysR family transcriptional regulator, partial [Klebsiella pneumoniae]|nr:LysR family transcriptional regulator [Klebsiella pneumoniae]
MDIRQLKAFVAVFEERSITLAAQRLFVTQPT